MESKQTINKYDIVQVNPEHSWGGSFIVVEDINDWGIQGYCDIPKKGQAYIRLNYDEFVKVGKAYYIYGDEE